jgi:predicted GTPase
LGAYLIELYSGRLSLGARRWRELVQGGPAADGEPEPVRQTAVALIGQVNAGKSSLINALLGEQKAETDVLPATSAVTRYRLRPEGVDAELDLLDTPGYGDAGPDDAQVRQAEEAARAADVLLLVLHARNPARAADVQMLDALKKWFDDHPHLRMPPVLGVLTHVDLLSPVMEWAPPYDWQDPKRPKEQSIGQAVEAAREQLGGRVDAVVPVCTAPGKLFGIEEGVLPVIAARLDEARAVAVLRCLHQERDTGKVRRVFAQMLAAGKALLGALSEKRR